MSADTFSFRDEWEFMQAMDEYKKKTGHRFPTWSEGYRVMVALGYRRAATDAGGAA